MKAAATYAGCGILDLLTPQERDALQPWMPLVRDLFLAAGQGLRRAQQIADRRSARRRR